MSAPTKFSNHKETRSESQKSTWQPPYCHSSLGHHNNNNNLYDTIDHSLLIARSIFKRRNHSPPFYRIDTLNITITL